MITHAEPGRHHHEGDTATLVSRKGDLEDGTSDARLHAGLLEERCAEILSPEVRNSAEGSGQISSAAFGPIARTEQIRVKGNAIEVITRTRLRVITVRKVPKAPEIYLARCGNALFLVSTRGKLVVSESTGRGKDWVMEVISQLNTGIETARISDQKFAADDGSALAVSISFEKARIKAPRFDYTWEELAEMYAGGVQNFAAYLAKRGLVGSLSGRYVTEFVPAGVNGLTAVGLTWLTTEADVLYSGKRQCWSLSSNASEGLKLVPRKCECSTPKKIRCREICYREGSLLFLCETRLSKLIRSVNEMGGGRTSDSAVQAITVVMRGDGRVTTPTQIAYATAAIVCTVAMGTAVALAAAGRLVELMLAVFAALIVLLAGIGRRKDPEAGLSLDTFRPSLPVDTLGAAFNCVHGVKAYDYGDADGARRLPGTYVNTDPRQEREIMDAVVAGLVVKSVRRHVADTGACVLGAASGSGKVLWDVVSTARRLEARGLLVFEGALLVPTSSGYTVITTRRSGPESWHTEWEEASAQASCMLKSVPGDDVLAGRTLPQLVDELDIDRDVYSEGIARACVKRLVEAETAYSAREPSFERDVKSPQQFRKTHRRIWNFGKLGWAVSDW